MPGLRVTDGTVGIPWDWESRYTPLVVWLLSAAALLLTPLQIISYGYHPHDDALRHAAKAVSGKSWDEILVMGPDIEGFHWGWHQLLSWVHHGLGISVDGLVVFSVLVLFLLFAFLPLLAVRRPEAWILALATLGFSSFWRIERLFFGRPFLTGMVVTLGLLLGYRQFTKKENNWVAMGLLALGVAASVWMRSAWYLYLIPLLAVICCRNWRAVVRIGGAMVVGSVVGALLTGNAHEVLVVSLAHSLKVTGRGLTASQLVSELQPGTGYFALPLIVLGLWVLQVARGKWSWRRLDHPAFYLMLGAWILSFRMIRFWDDFGVVAGLVLLFREYQDLLDDSPVKGDAVARMAVTLIGCGVLFASYTADAKSRWTWNLSLSYMDASDEEIAPWLPDDGGILYSTSMSVFYQTFYANPHAPWRYALGFEARLMTEENRDVYHHIKWNNDAYEAYDPWVEKMRPEDRLIIRSGSRSARPRIEELEWHYVVTGTWSGRLPRGGTAVPSSAPTGEDGPPHPE